MEKFVVTPGYRDHVFACNVTMYNNNKVFQYALPEISKGQNIEEIMERYVLLHLNSYYGHFYHVSSLLHVFLFQDL